MNSITIKKSELIRVVWWWNPRQETSAPRRAVQIGKASRVMGLVRVAGGDGILEDREQSHACPQLCRNLRLSRIRCQACLGIVEA